MQKLANLDQKWSTAEGSKFRNPIGVSRRESPFDESRSGSRDSENWAIDPKLQFWAILKSSTPNFSSNSSLGIIFWWFEAKKVYFLQIDFSAFISKMPKIR